MIVSLVYAQQQTTDLQSHLSKFSSACGALVEASSSPAAGLGARFLGQLFRVALYSAADQLGARQGHGA
jgi:hypothetical protein